MSDLKVDTITNLSGGAVELPGFQGVAKAWIKFDGVNNIILDSLNISSVQDNGTGNYTVFFTNNFSTIDYCVQVSSIRQTTLNISNYAEVCSITNPQFNNCTVWSTVATTSSGIPENDTTFYLTIFSD